jgi:hypothetical protein
LVRVLQNGGGLRLKAEVVEQVCQLSAYTVDHLLKPYRHPDAFRAPLEHHQAWGLLKESVPIRTFADWEEDRPGFLEVDPSANSRQALVAHCGESTEGFYLNTLSTVDGATGWVKCQGVPS